MDKNNKQNNVEDIFSQFKFEEFQEPGADINNQLVTDLSDLDTDDVDKQIEAAKEKAVKKVKESTPEDVDTDEDEEVISTEDSDDTEEEDKSDSTEDKTEEDEEEVTYEISFKPLVDSLSEKGILVLKEDEDFEDSDEGLEGVIVNTIKAGINEYKESLPEVVKDLTDFIELGGDIGSYLQAKANLTTLDNIDITVEDNQEKVIKAYLKSQEYSEEEIDEAIEDYKDTMILDKEAKRALTKLKKIAEKEDAELIENQRKIEEDQRKEYEKYVGEIKSTILKTNDIAGFPISEKDKKSFVDYLTKTDRNGETEYAKDLKKDYMNNSIALAYFKFKNFEFKDLEKKVEKKVTKNLKQQMAKPTTKQAKGATKAPVERTEAEDFKAFRNIWNN